MKQRLLSVLLIMISFYGLAQNCDALNTKNGFRHFKLGALKSEITNLERKQKQFSKNPNVEEYYYRGDAINTVFNRVVEEITLTFFKGRLTEISVSFGNMITDSQFTLEDYNVILYGLEASYGKDWVGLKTTPELLNGAAWQCERVSIELMRCDFGKPGDSFKTGYLRIYSNSLLTEMRKSEF